MISVHTSTYWFYTECKCIPTSMAFYNLSQESSFPWAMRTLKGKSGSKLLQVCSWSAGSSFSVIPSKFNQPHNLSDPNGVDKDLESNALELSNDANVFEIYL